ncbi:carbamoyl-phosphate synthase small subunit [Carnobacterium iners]|uniref:Carbamoyl phosphate synthase small chain n=1 Tax=Carnobacterium iners TaxID=1073423 RepID=A0A1X7NGX5_9LACT|nr:carbamoyl phosphate synthase small subunit [Carnobacterium iners]SEK39103.1 carbamoyl-phosphate synthase small subunit [Carnobacterium iners]SMH36331.1 carbamoyl-phosphate synthase small subunit [Carnobacterium iners]
MDRILLLEDGSMFKGKGFGSLIDTIGEVVFTTGVTGYQEIITDQSYNGQMIVFNYPSIGNTGINRNDYESIEPTCKAVIVKEFARVPSNWHSQMNLDEFLKNKKIPGITGVDTRKLMHLLQKKGVMRGTIVDAQDDFKHAFDQLKATVLPIQQVEQVSTSRAYVSPGNGRNISVIDFGLKHSLLKELNKRNCQVTVLPYDTSAESILNLEPDGVLLTNGPGNPNDLPAVLTMIQTIQSKVPLFATGLGHQLLALANGCTVVKMKVGHRGLNHPVKDLASGDFYLTAQNHGFLVDYDSIDQTVLAVSHIELNDGSIEGIKHRHLPSFSVQFNPDAGPGPHDATHVFDQFMVVVDDWKEKKGV